MMVEGPLLQLGCLLKSVGFVLLTEEDIATKTSLTFI